MDTELALFLRQHIEDEYLEDANLRPNSLDFTMDRDDRFYGQDINGNSVVIFLRIVGEDNSGPYRGWLTYRIRDFESLRVGRPPGYRYLSLVVGMAPDRQVWYTALYEESRLDLSKAELKEVGRGSFWRWPPEALTFAKLGERDILQPSMKLDEPKLEPMVIAFTEPELQRALEESFKLFGYDGPMYPKDRPQTLARAVITYLGGTP